MSTRQRATKLAKVLSAIAISCFALNSHAGCYWCFNPATVAAEVGIDTGTIASEAVAADASIAMSILYNTQRLLSAESTKVKGKALGGNDVSRTALDAQHMIAQAMASADAQARIAEAAINYSAEFGQGYEPCKDIANRGVISEAMGQESSQTKAMTRTFYGAPGRMGDRITTANKRRDDFAPFCTSDLNFCDPGKYGNLQGDNTDNRCLALDASNLLEDRYAGDIKHDAIKFLADTLIGDPAPKLAKGAAGNPATNAAMQTYLTQAAIDSTAQASLAALMTETTAGLDGEDQDPEELSIHARLKKEASKYAGAGEEALKWARVMAQQKEHGLLIELLKAKAFDLALMERQYRQYERIESMLAALVARRSQAAADAAAVAAARAGERGRE